MTDYIEIIPGSGRYTTVLPRTFENTERVDLFGVKCRAPEPFDKRGQCDPIPVEWAYVEMQDAIGDFGIHLIEEELENWCDHYLTAPHPTSRVELLSQCPLATPRGWSYFCEAGSTLGDLNGNIDFYYHSHSYIGGYLTTFLRTQSEYIYKSDCEVLGLYPGVYVSIQGQLIIRCLRNEAGLLLHEISLLLVIDSYVNVTQVWTMCSDSLLITGWSDDAVGLGYLQQHEDGTYFRCCRGFEYGRPIYLRGNAYLVGDLRAGSGFGPIGPDPSYHGDRKLIKVSYASFRDIPYECSKPPSDDYLPYIEYTNFNSFGQFRLITAKYQGDP